MIALLVMTDGRDTIGPTIEAARQLLGGSISERWIHDDSGSAAHSADLERRFPEFEVIRARGRSGFGGAIRNAWKILAARSGAPFVFHLEDDFVFRRPVNLDALAAVLDQRPHLAQLAFRRQAWNPAEIAAGGVVEQHPGDYTEVAAPELAPVLGFEPRWLEHRRYFTTNPSLYRSALRDRRWPTGSRSEGRFSAELFKDPATRCGLWGGFESGREWVHHIGHERIGTGY